jgi:hypothetical protein
MHKIFQFIKFLLRKVRQFFFGAKFRIVKIEDIHGVNCFQVQQKKLSMSTTTANVFDWVPIVTYTTYDEAKKMFDRIVELGGTNRVKVIKKI